MDEFYRLIRVKLKLMEELLIWNHCNVRMAFQGRCHICCIAEFYSLKLLKWSQKHDMCTYPGLDVSWVNKGHCDQLFNLLSV